MQIVDRRRTADGFLATKGRISKTGIYDYTRHELNLDGNPNEIVKIYRPEDAVFSDESMASAAHRPLTLNHPPVFVDASNWKKYSVGHAGGKVRRDGEHVEVDMLIMDGPAITAVEGGAMLSPGYTASITMGEGQSPEGQHFDGVMEGPYSFNHIAVLTGPGRGGATCRLGDAWPVETKDSNHKKEVTVKTIVIDSIPYTVENLDGLEAAINKVIAAKDTVDKLAADNAKALADAQAIAATEAAAAATALADEQAKTATLEAQIATLNTQLADAQSPEKLADAAAARAALVDAATKLGVADAAKMKDSEIRKAVVSARLGDKAANWTDAQIVVSFDTLAASIKDGEVDPYRVAMGDRKVADFNVNDEVAAARKAREDYIKSLNNPASAEAK